MRADPRRARRRRALYLIAILPSLLMVLVSARLFLLLYHDGRGHTAYELSEYEGARDHFAANRILNPVERWKAPLNEGDARYRLADHAGAIEAFEVALGFAPSQWECPIRVNLALAHEAAGDALLDRGNRAAAEGQWRLGREAVEPCTGDPDAESGAADSTGDSSEDGVDDSSGDSSDDSSAGAEDATGEDSAKDSDASSEESAEDGSSDGPPSEDEARASAVEVDDRLAGKLGEDAARSRESVDPADDETRAKEEIVEERNEKAREERARDDDPPPRRGGNDANW